MIDNDDPSELSRRDSIELLRRRYFDESLIPPDLIPTEDLEVDAEAPDISQSKSVDVFSSNEFSVVEKLDVDEDTAKFLASVINLLTEGNSSDLNIATCFRNLKVDEAILTSDPELDIVHLRHRNDIRLIHDRVRLHGLKEEQDATQHGLVNTPNIPSELEIADEKLEVDNPTATYLREILINLKKDDEMLIRPTANYQVSVIFWDLDFVDLQCQAHTELSSPPLLPMPPLYNPSDAECSITQDQPRSSPDYLEELVPDNLTEAAIDNNVIETPLEIHGVPESIGQNLGIEPGSTPTIMWENSSSSPLQGKCKRPHEHRSESSLLSHPEQTNVSAKKPKIANFPKKLPNFTVEFDLKSDYKVQSSARKFDISHLSDVTRSEDLTVEDVQTAFHEEDTHAATELSLPGKDENALSNPTPKLPQLANCLPSMDDLLQKRRLEFEKRTDDVPTSTPFYPSAGNDTVAATLRHGKPTEKTETGMLSNPTNLTTFMHLQGKSTPSSCQNTSFLLPLKRTSTPVASPKPFQGENDAATASDVKQHIPSPRIDCPQTALPVIVSSTIMANRAIIRRIQSQLPTLDIIERDFFYPTGAPSNMTTPHLSSADADITISPSTGIILTHLQRLKQKPLPGQTIFSGVRKQILRIAPRYERLIVIISEGQGVSSFPFSSSFSSEIDKIDDRSIAPQTLDARDCRAITDLIHSSATIDTVVQIFYVPGGPHQLADWTAAAISKFATVSSPQQGDGGAGLLLHEETIWERFLRAAGMNAFAAQVVLGYMNGSSTNRSSYPANDDDDDVKQSDGERNGASSSGLAGFVCMSAEERVWRFEKVLGGSKMLTRVNRVLDTTWRTEKKLPKLQ